MRIINYSSFQALPDGYASLFERAESHSFCLTRWWFESLAETISPPDRLCLIAAERDATGKHPMALLPCYLNDLSSNLGRGKSLLSLSSYYSMIYAPLMADCNEPTRVLATMLVNLRRQYPRCAMLRFQPLDPASPLFNALLSGLGQAGLVAQPFFHLGNWYERTERINSRGYLAGRPSALRNTLRRKQKRIVEAGAYLKVTTGGDALEPALRDYELIYSHSWKVPEPHPGVIRDLARHCSAERALRLGILYLGGRPVAAQVWIVWNRKATLYKLAHDKEFDHLSPGTALTFRMLERVIDGDGVVEVDFGVGDDLYKHDWASARRELWGIIAFDTKTLTGAMGAMRHIGAQKCKNIREKLITRRKKGVISCGRYGTSR